MRLLAEFRGVDWQAKYLYGILKVAFPRAGVQLDSSRDADVVRLAVEDGVCEVSYGYEHLYLKVTTTVGEHSKDNNYQFDDIWELVKFIKNVLMPL